MDINRIRYFLSLSQTGNIARAAELHRISPPAFSKAMKVFEEEMGQKLLVAHGRGVLLTDHAKSLVPGLKKIIQDLDRLRETGAKESQSVVKIATFEVFSTYFIERGMGDIFKDQACEIYEMIPGAMEQAVASRQADFALTYNPIPHPELDFLKVQSVAMGVFGHKKFRSMDFKKIPFAVPLANVEAAPSKVKGLDGWPDDRLPRNVVYKVGMMETALGLCRRGHSCAFLPKFVVRLHNEISRPEYHLSEITSPYNGNKDYVYLIKRKTDTEGTTAKKLGAFIRKICSGD